MNKHKQLESLVSGILQTQGHQVQRSVVYRRGEMDVVCNGIYYEVKTNYTDKNRKKAEDQIQRALIYRQAKYGYLVTKDGIYDVFQDLMIGGEE